MGNSEVGHLTIGSGRILFQDLARVNQRGRGRLVRTKRRAHVGVPAGARARRRRPSARARLVRRRALAHRPSARAARARRARGDGGADVDPRVHGRARRVAACGGRTISRSCPLRGSPPSAGATTRWIATTAGSGPIAPSARSRRGEGAHADDPGRGGARELRAGSDRRVRRAGRARRASAARVRATPRSSSTSVPIARGSCRSGCSRREST